MKKLLCPSMNCANFDCLRAETIALDDAGADIFHIDISDGTIFPKLSMGYRDFQSIRRNTDKMVDVHLYMSHPDRFIELFAQNGADIIYVFPETEPFIAATLYKIRRLGKHPGLAVGWGTSLEVLTDLIPLADYIMVNTADPSADKSIFMEEVIPKLIRLAELKQKYTYKVLLDGAITPEIIKRMSVLGIDGFAMGTGCLFGVPGDYQSIFKDLRNC